MIKSEDKQIVAVGILSILNFIFLPFIRIKPNRISMGELIGSIELLGLNVIVIILLWAIIIALSFYAKKWRYLLQMLGAIGIGISIIIMIPAQSKEYLSSPSSRISLSSGFYMQLLWIYLVLIIGNKNIKSRRLLKTLINLVPIGIIFYIFSAGLLDDFSIVKEFVSKKNQFFDNLRIHSALTIFSVLTGIIISLPLGFIAYKKRSYENKIMLPLSIIETIPSLSLFGILLVPLSKLGRIGFLNDLGISGIGWAPAYIALTLYTLLPIGRNTLAGFSSVDKGAIEAAKGMGMKPLEILFKIELPLAFPVIFTGIRIAFTQTIGGAVLAGLVGGGGLGTFVFLGLAEASPDLILLGVIPIVILTIGIDILLKISGEAIRSGIYD